MAADVVALPVNDTELLAFVLAKSPVLRDLSEPPTSFPEVCALLTPLPVDTYGTDITARDALTRLFVASQTPQVSRLLYGYDTVSPALDGASEAALNATGRLADYLVMTQAQKDMEHALDTQQQYTRNGREKLLKVCQQGWRPWVYFHDIPGLQWAYDHRLPTDRTWEPICVFAASLGKLRVLQWARAHGFPWSCEDNEHYISEHYISMRYPVYTRQLTVMDVAASQGFVDILQWAHEHGAPWSVETCIEAAQTGHLAALQYLHAAGCPWDASTCANAALEGHLDILQWAHAHGCPWDENTCTQAAIYSHWHVVQWAADHGCPLPEWLTFDAAQRRYKPTWQ